MIRLIIIKYLYKTHIMARNVDTPENNDSIMEELLDTVKRMELEIATIKKQLAGQEPFYYPPIQVNNPDPCSDGGYHEYPNPWHSITPAPCKRCGKLAPDNPITFTNKGTGNPPWNFNDHGGNVMGNENPIITHDSTKTNYISDTSRLF